MNDKLPPIFAGRRQLPQRTYTTETCSPQEEIQDAIRSWWDDQQQIELIDKRIEHLEGLLQQAEYAKAFCSQRQAQAANVSPEARDLLDSCPHVNAGDLRADWDFSADVPQMSVSRCWDLGSGT